MDENDTGFPDTQLDRAELLLLYLEDHDLCPLDLLDALSSAGMKLVMDPGGECAGEYYGVLKSAVRAEKAPLN